MFGCVSVPRLCVVIQCGPRCGPGSWEVLGVSAPPSGVAVGRGKDGDKKCSRSSTLSVKSTCTHWTFYTSVNHCNILSRVDCSVYYGPASRACACVLLNSVFSFLTTHPATTSLYRNVLGASMFFAASTSFPASYTGKFGRVRRAPALVPDGAQAGQLSTPA